ncbi:MAG TPA: type I methionyl aminopeptidase [Chloroflexota bacterium]|nr:type I methionyl aminopeptidase [Chloroflexota bacterium]
MITIKSEAEFELMRRAGRLVAETLDKLRHAVKPGITTADLDKIAYEHITKHNGIPSFKGYPGPGGAVRFPASICASVNDAVVHGIPSKKQVLEEGDIVSIDCGAIVEGWHGDAALTVGVGKITPDAERLMAVTRDSLFKGVEHVQAGTRLGDVSAAIQHYAEGQGFSVVREYVGHGIGRQMHEDPQVPNWGTPGRGMLLKEGMALALEPMINAGAAEVRVLQDQWTVVTKDGSLSAHFEHTVALTSNGPEILTKL